MKLKCGLTILACVFTMHQAFALGDKIENYPVSSQSDLTAPLKLRTDSGASIELSNVADIHKLTLIDKPSKVGVIQFQTVLGPVSFKLNQKIDFSTLGDNVYSVPTGVVADLGSSGQNYGLKIAVGRFHDDPNPTTTTRTEACTGTDRATVCESVRRRDSRGRVTIERVCRDITVIYHGYRIIDTKTEINNVTYEISFLDSTAGEVATYNFTAVDFNSTSTIGAGGVCIRSSSPIPNFN